MNYLCIVAIVIASSFLPQPSEARKHQYSRKQDPGGKQYNDKRIQGRPIKQYRITNSSTLRYAAYPYIASIHYVQATFSGVGALIGEYWVVTGAQTVSSFSQTDILANKIYIQANGNSNGNWSAENKNFVFKCYIHELFNSALDYDIALLKVTNPFSSKTNKFAIIGSRDKYGVGCLGYIFGWGKTTSSFNMSIIHDDLRFGKVELFNFKACQEMYKSVGGLVTKRMICAYNWETNACITDGGGPLFTNDDIHKGVLIGIISWGAPGRCEKSVYPGVYTRVPAFREWIEEKMNNNR